MPKHMIEYNILISCPSDVQEEVDIIKEVVKDFNANFSELKGIRLQTKDWKHDSYPESGGKPQALLNKQLVQECDAAVAVFWTHFGSPTDYYESGTEEEIDIMLSSGKQVFMYFSDKPISPSKQDPEGYQKICNFRAKYKNQGIYFTYIDNDSFKELFTEHLKKYFLNLEPEEAEKTSVLNPEKEGIEKTIGDKISDALFQVREIELLAEQVDICGIQQLLEGSEGCINFFEPGPCCPAITSSIEAFLDFSNKISLAREEFEKYLNHKLAAYLYYMERYCMNALTFIGQYKIPVELFGAVTLFDFQNWQKQFDMALVQAINNPEFKLYSRTGTLWEQEKEKIMNQLWVNSILYRVMNKDESPEIVAARAILLQDPAAEELVNNLK